MSNHNIKVIKISLTQTGWKVLYKLDTSKKQLNLFILRLFVLITLISLGIHGCLLRLNWINSFLLLEISWALLASENNSCLSSRHSLSWEKWMFENLIWKYAYTAILNVRFLILLIQKLLCSFIIVIWKLHSILQDLLMWFIKKLANIVYRSWKKVLIFVIITPAQYSQK